MLAVFDVMRLLAERGTAVNAGLSDHTILELAGAKGIVLDPFVASLYAEFDGFPHGAIDSGSGFHVWPLARVMSVEGGTGSRRSFADFLIGSNEYTFDLSNAAAPVLDREDDSLLSDSFRGFWEQLVSGKLDFE